MIRTFISLLLLGQFCLAVDRQSFEFRGLMTGLSEEKVRAKLTDRYRTEHGNRPPECFNTGAGRVCGLNNYSIAISDKGIAWGITYTFPSHSVAETPEAFAEALTTKYGRPAVTIRHYSTGLGAEISGKEFTWTSGTQELQVSQFCGNINSHCVRIIDTAFGPTRQTPKI